MRAVIQRVREATVTIDSVETARIGRGFVVLLGIEEADEPGDAAWLAGKIARLRVFADEAGAMNLALDEAGGDVLVVSQFTLHASTKKGNRPSFIRAARPERAIPLYELLLHHIEAECGRRPATGRFGADMQISLTNDGPVTLIIDSRARE